MLCIRPCFETTRPDTRTGIVACGWAGAVMWGAGAAGGPVYTTTSVSCDWAGAVMQKPLANQVLRRQKTGRL